MKLIKEQEGQTFGVVNVPGSTIARLTDNGLFTRAGTEIGVASTKAFTAQSVCLLLTALFMAKKRGLRYAVYKDIMHELEQLPMLLETILSQSDYIRSVAQQLTEYQHCF
ncbi:SIS domain-containing protein, partial [Patescibacteria group bacterium]|nr:SIS domain-containing protein [Patescibacteria group bacterium]